MRKMRFNLSKGKSGKYYRLEIWNSQTRENITFTINLTPEELEDLSQVIKEEKSANTPKKIKDEEEEEKCPKCGHVIYDFVRGTITCKCGFLNKTFDEDEDY